jgi:hypothetical protein
MKRSPTRQKITDLYAAYGSNLNFTQMKSRCPAAEPAGRFALDGWAFIINERGVATIVPATRSEVLGGLWRVTPACVRTLDRYEGVASGFYRKERATVVDERGVDRDVLVYLAAEARPGLPRPGYLEGILAGAGDFALPTHYLAFLASFGRRAKPTAAEGAIAMTKSKGRGRLPSGFVPIAKPTAAEVKRIKESLAKGFGQGGKFRHLTPHVFYVGDTVRFLDDKGVRRTGEVVRVGKRQLVIDDGDFEWGIEPQHVTPLKDVTPKGNPPDPDGEDYAELVEHIRGLQESQNELVAPGEEPMTFEGAAECAMDNLQDDGPKEYFYGQRISRLTADQIYKLAELAVEKEKKK